MNGYLWVQGKCPYLKFILALSMQRMYRILFTLSLSIYPSIYLFLSISLSICLYICVCLFIKFYLLYPYLSLSFYLSINLSFYIFHDSTYNLYLSIYLLSQISISFPKYSYFYLSRNPSIYILYISCIYIFRINNKSNYLCIYPSSYSFLSI